ncbi:hypothetical protein Q0P04_14015, partial [Staphylococcus aureus]|nr:hypothetical protein [Staphylococcus aureus]
ALAGHDAQAAEQNKKPPYKLEIEMLKQQQFDPEIKNKVMQQ